MRADGNDLLLLTHVPADGTFHNGVMDVPVELALDAFPGDVGAVTRYERDAQPVGGADAYDLVVADENRGGRLSDATADELVEGYDQIFRGGGCYGQCMAETDGSLDADLVLVPELTYTATRGHGVRLRSERRLGQFDEYPDYRHPHDEAGMDAVTGAWTDAADGYWQDCMDEGRYDAALEWSERFDLDMEKSREAAAMTANAFLDPDEQPSFTADFWQQYRTAPWATPRQKANRLVGVYGLDEDPYASRLEL